MTRGGPPRRIRVWRDVRLRAGAAGGTTPDPIEFLADRVLAAGRAWGDVRPLVWLDPGGPTLGPEAEGVLTAFPSRVVTLDDPDPDRFAAALDHLATPGPAGAGPAGTDPPGTPRYRGGWIGHIAYEAIGALEPVRLTARRDLQIPLVAMAEHPVWFRHLPEQGRLELWTTCPGDVETADDGRRLPSLAAWVHWAEEALRAPYDSTTPMLVFPPHLLPGGSAAAGAVDRLLAGSVRSFDRAAFEAAVCAAQVAVREGEVFQANIAQRFGVRCTADPFHVHLHLRRLNPSPHAAYLETDRGVLVSNSPERLVRVRRDGADLVAETRPIAGTRPRRADRETDRLEVEGLRASAKERAEHTMLVDLARNDLGRISVPGSVRVDEFQSVEAYSHVHHLVSNVQGVVRPEAKLSDLVRALFPGGTITGAPKLRSVEVIDRLEPVARGPYTGSLGHINRDGTLDLNIMIRTIFFQRSMAWVYAGAGIVADSDPASEYDETLHKAAAMLSALARNETPSTEATARDAPADPETARPTPTVSSGGPR